MTRNQRHGCAACLSIGTGYRLIADRYYCRECYAEKAEGEVPPGTVNTMGSQRRVKDRAAHAGIAYRGDSGHTGEW